MFHDCIRIESPLKACRVALDRRRLKNPAQYSYRIAVSWDEPLAPTVYLQPLTKLLKDPKLFLEKAVKNRQERLPRGSIGVEFTHFQETS